MIKSNYPTDGNVSGAYLVINETTNDFKLAIIMIREHCGTGSVYSSPGRREAFSSS